MGGSGRDSARAHHALKPADEHGFRATAVRALAIGLRPGRPNVYYWACWAAALGVQITFVMLLRNGKIYAWERALARELQDIPYRYEIFDTGHFLTNTISWQFLPVFGSVVLVAVILRHRTAAALLFLTFPLHVLAQWPKAVVERERPPAGYEGLDGIGGMQSFPSGHAEFVVTFWGFVVYLVWIHARGWMARTFVLIGWATLIVGVGVGRIAIGRHWPMDILVAFTTGLGLLSGLVWLYSTIRQAQTLPYGKEQGREVYPKEGIYGD